MRASPVEKEYPKRILIQDPGLCGPPDRGAAISCGRSRGTRVLGIMWRRVRPSYRNYYAQADLGLCANDAH